MNFKINENNQSEILKICNVFIYSSEHFCWDDTNGHVKLLICSQFVINVVNHINIRVNFLENLRVKVIQMMRDKQKAFFTAFNFTN